jgi:hypothetical protein
MFEFKFGDGLNIVFVGNNTVYRADRYAGWLIVSTYTLCAPVRVDHIDGIRGSLLRLLPDTSSSFLSFFFYNFTIFSPLMPFASKIFLVLQ